MILHELRALALREGLVDDPAFESNPVRWVIVLDEDGSYRSLRDTLQDVPLKERQKGKAKQQASMFAIPRRLGRTSKAVSDFLVDKSEYVLGVEPDEKRSADDLRARRAMFVDLCGKRLTQRRARQAGRSRASSPTIRNASSAPTNLPNKVTPETPFYLSRGRRIPSCGRGAWEMVEKAHKLQQSG